MTALSALRDAQFLSGSRARIYGALLAGTMGLALCFGYLSLALGHHPFQPAAQPGRPGASDFVAFWEAGRFALQGRAADAYNLPRLSAAEHADTSLDPDALLAFFYPPTFLLLCLPFAALPYLAGFAAFVAAQTAALLACLRRILPPSWGWLPAICFPGLLLNAATGQNGFISAACFGAALLLLERRPWLAGAVLGVLIIKPHLALAVPVALIAARRWRAAAGAGLTSAAWLAGSWLVLGTAAWRAFFDAAPRIRLALEQHQEDWAKLQSVFSTTRLLGGSLGLAYAVQAVVAVAVLALLATVCWRQRNAAAQSAIMASAAMLGSPHLLDYDLAVTGVPLAWIARQGAERGWLPWEKTGAALVFLWPLVARVATEKYHVAVAPLVLLVLFALVFRRAWRGPLAAA